MSIEFDRAEVTAILDALAREKGEPRAARELLPLVYGAQEQAGTFLASPATEADPAPDTSDGIDR